MDHLRGYYTIFTQFYQSYMLLYNFIFIYGQFPIFPVLKICVKGQGVKWQGAKGEVRYVHFIRERE